MSFDPDKFSAAAKQAGYTDDEIRSEVERQTKNINAATGQEFGKAGEDAVQGKAQEWRNQGSPVPGTEKPEDVRSLGSQLFDWANTPAGNAVLGGLGLAGVTAAGIGINARKKGQAEPAPRVEPYVAPSYDFETTAREVPESRGLPQPSTPAPQAAAPTAPVPAPAPTGIPQPAPQVAMPGEQQPQMKYGETKYNVPTASPDIPVVPPVEVAPAAVAPLTDKQRREKAMADLAEHRLEEAKKASAAAEVKKTETTVQKSQGKAFNNQDNTILSNAEKIKAEKSIEAAGVTKAPKAAPVASVAPPVVAPPVVAPAPVAATPVAPVAAAPAVPPATGSLTKEQKGMKNYLVSQYGGGPEGEAAYKKTIDILGEVPAYEKGQGGGLSKEANDTIKAWRKSNIEGPKVNLTHDMKKVMKGAGGAGILMALPGFAEAAQRKDMGKMSDIFTDFFVLPFAQSREAGMSKREEESIIANKFKEASKLGSPYRSVPPPR
jgi:hypothetical protein